MSIASWRPRIIINSVSDCGCRFCGSPKNYMARPAGAWAIVCASCGSRGPVCDGTHSAIAAWEGVTYGL